MKTISFTFLIYNEFIPESKSKKDWEYFKLPLNIFRKKWAVGLSLKDIGLLTYICEATVINKSPDYHSPIIQLSRDYQSSCSRLMSVLKKFEQNGIVSNIKINTIHTKQNITEHNYTHISKPSLPPPPFSDFVGKQVTKKKGSPVAVRWEDIKDVVFAKAKELHGYNDKFMEERWAELLAYDEGKPYTNRKSGATNWFNGNITKEKWEKVKPQMSIAEKYKDLLGLGDLE